MNEEKKYKLRAFMWDQFVLPLYSLFTTELLRSIMIAFLVINFISLKSLGVFILFTAMIIITAILDLIKYWRSGEYIKHYRDHKYPEYRKAIKQIRKEKKLKGEQYGKENNQEECTYSNDAQDKEQV